MEVNAESNAEHSPQAEVLSLAEWSVRDEIYAATQRWYLVLLCCLVGSLLGWAVVWVWPSPHRASKELFVGLNVYQSGDDRNARESSALPIGNANDYKNWQMASLNTMIYTDPVLTETLRRLRAQDSYWNSVEIEELARMLHAYWRNAGKWRLVAEHGIPMYAAAAVILWQDVIVEQVHASVAAAQQTLQYDLQMQATAGAQSGAANQVAALSGAQMQLQVLRARLEDLPDTGTPDEAVRMQLWQAAAPLIETEGGKLLEEGFPAPKASVSVLLEWLDQAAPVLEAELSRFNWQYETHSQRYEQLAQQYAQAADASFGLSAELQVQKISDRKLDAMEVRPTGQAMLVGAGLGSIVWFLMWLVRPVLKTARQAAAEGEGRRAA